MFHITPLIIDVYMVFHIWLSTYVHVDWTRLRLQNPQGSQPKDEKHIKL